MNIENYVSALTKIENLIHQANNALNQVIGALTAEQDLRSEQDIIKEGVSTIKNSALNPASIIPDVRKIQLKEQEKMPKLKNIYIYKREKYYYVSVVKDGIRKNFTRKNKTEAIKQAKNYLENLNAQCNPTSSSTLNNLATFFLENLKKPFVSEVYYKSLTKTYNKHVKNNIGNYAIKSITAVMLQGYFENLTSYSTRIAEDVKTLLNQIFEYSIGNSFINVNPMRAVKVLRHIRQNGQALSREQIENLKTAIKNTKYEIPFLIFLYTGIRGSEYHSLQFDFNNNTVTITNSKLKTYQKQKFREIPILPNLKPYREDIEREMWREIKLQEIERRYTDFVKIGRLNWLRHTFQTYCSLKASNELVNFWAGHDLGSNMTAKVYTHFPMEYQQEIATNITY